MKKILSVILTVVDVILIFCCIDLCDPDSLLDSLETDPDTFMDVFGFGFSFANLFLILISLVYDTFLLIFRKIRKTLEKQGKE